MNDNIREKQITRTSIITILVNVLMAGFKAIVGLISGSIAILLDAVNNLSDALSSMITIAGIKLAKRRPDKKHPFGYGRVEYFSALLISGIVLAAGVTSLVESVKAIFAPEAPTFNAATLIILIVALVGKFLLGSFVISQGKRYNSDSLVASGTEARLDGVVSAATLVSAILAITVHLNLDGIVGAVIAVLIVKAGIELLLESISNVMGNRPDSEVTKEIKAAVRKVDGVMGAYDLVLHNYGPESSIGSVHIEVHGDVSATELHVITKNVQQAILDQFGIALTVGIYAVDRARKEERGRMMRIVNAHKGTLGSHGYYINDEKRYISFDVVLDFTVADKEGFRSELVREIGELYPGYTIDITFDVNYSD